MKKGYWYNNENIWDINIYEEEEAMEAIGYGLPLEYVESDEEGGQIEDGKD